MVLHLAQPRFSTHQFRNEMDRLLSGWLRQPADRSWPHTSQQQPAVNVWEDSDKLTVEMEIPGVKSDQVDISVVGDELSLKIECSDQIREGVTYHRRERPVGSFTRVLRLPVDVDAERVDAALHNGVLTISLPKAESAKPRKIEVATA